MASGHTDKATINARRKLTTGMVDLLRDMIIDPRGYINRIDMTEGEKSQARGLMDRGYATPDDTGKRWSATPAGRQALQEQGS